MQHQALLLLDMPQIWCCREDESSSGDSDNSDSDESENEQPPPEPNGAAVSAGKEEVKRKRGILPADPNHYDVMGLNALLSAAIEVDLLCPAWDQSSVKLCSSAMFKEQLTCKPDSRPQNPSPSNLKYTWSFVSLDAAGHRVSCSSWRIELIPCAPVN